MVSRALTCALIHVLALGSSAQAQDAIVVMAPATGRGVEARHAARIERAMRETIETQGGPDARFAGQTPSVRCLADVACVAQAGQSTGGTLIVGAGIEEPFNLTLVLVNAQTTTEISRHTYELRRRDLPEAGNRVMEFLASMPRPQAPQQPQVPRAQSLTPLPAAPVVVSQTPAEEPSRGPSEPSSVATPETPSAPPSEEPAEDSARIGLSPVLYGGVAIPLGSHSPGALLGLDVRLAPFSGQGFLERLSFDVGVDWNGSGVEEGFVVAPSRGYPETQSAVEEHSDLWFIYGGARAWYVRSGPIELDAGVAIGVVVNALRSFGQAESNSEARGAWALRTAIRGTHGLFQWAIETTWRGPFVTENSAQPFYEDTLSALHITASAGASL